MTFNVVDLIETKRDGGALPTAAIEWLIDSYTQGRVPDYQMSAMAMAIVLQGMSREELTAWTSAMLHSGEVLDFSALGLPKVDKHSTGGVGDKVSIPLAPLVAACGVAVPMMSGRGLGHTGGTLDKLETIPGFTVSLDPERFASILAEHGLVLAGQSETIAPADRELYALRNATGTVASIPLIASSIMSKKLAEGLDGLLLDIKTGSGAFMTELDASVELAQTMVDIGRGHDLKVVAFITSMEQPLGREVGNANEMAESVQVLRGEGPEDLTELTLLFGETMLELAGVESGRDRLEEAIASGRALAKLINVARAHGGDPSVIEDTRLLPRAGHEAVITAPSSGYVTRCDARTVGLCATRLGAGRERPDDQIDPGVGITIEAKVGVQVEAGDALAVVRYSDPSLWERYGETLASAWVVQEAPVSPPDLVIDRLG